MSIYPFFLLVLGPSRFIGHMYGLRGVVECEIHTGVILLLFGTISKLFYGDWCNLNFESKVLYALKLNNGETLINI